MTTEKSGLRYRILAPLGFVLLLLIALSLFSSYHLQRRHVNEQLRGQIQNASKLLQLKMQNDADLLNSQMDFLEEEQKRGITITSAATKWHSFSSVSRIFIRGTGSFWLFSIGIIAYWDRKAVESRLRALRMRRTS